METVSTSETSVSFYQTTRRNIPEDSHLQGCQVFLSILPSAIFKRHLYFFYQLFRLPYWLTLYAEHLPLHSRSVLFPQLVLARFFLLTGTKLHLKLGSVTERHGARIP
jgi:hypothetical protein